MSEMEQLERAFADYRRDTDAMLSDCYKSEARLWAKLNTLKALCDEHVSKIKERASTGKYIRTKDDEAHIFETAMRLTQGEDIFDKLNQLYAEMP